MATSNDADALGKAWAHHRMGRQAESIAAFSAILNAQPNQTDALYGRALAERSAGDFGSATADLELCRQIVEQRLAEDPENDTHEIMLRLIAQRTEELQAAVR